LDMKILIISDSHGNIANLKTVMDIGKKAGVKAVIHCGDWNNPESVETVLSYKIPLYSILGNADIDLEVGKRLKVKSKGFDTNFLEFEIDGKKIGVAHSLKHLMPIIKSFDVIFSGHSHRQKVEEKDGAKIINPGALENDINFAIYDTNINEVEFINEQEGTA